jgi:hypothetical protein
MLNFIGTLKLNLSPSNPSGGTGNGCARRTVASGQRRGDDAAAAQEAPGRRPPPKLTVVAG